MGKNPVSKRSSKIFKAPKNQFPSLAKVLRPKVYITDFSNFKSLVQELTGNGMSHFQSLSPPPSHKIHTSPSQEVGNYYGIEQTPLEEYGHRGELYSATEESSIDQDGSTTSLSTVETSTSSSLESFSQQRFLMEDVDDQVLVDLLAVRDIETWLLDF